MMESISKANHMVKAGIFGQMEIATMEDFSKARVQVTEYWLEGAVKPTKDISKMI